MKKRGFDDVLSAKRIDRFAFVYMAEDGGVAGTADATGAAGVGIAAEDDDAADDGMAEEDGVAEERAAGIGMERTLAAAALNMASVRTRCALSSANLASCPAMSTDHIGSAAATCVASRQRLYRHSAGGKGRSCVVCVSLGCATRKVLTTQVRYRGFSAPCEVPPQRGLAAAARCRSMSERTESGRPTVLGVV